MLKRNISRGLYDDIEVVFVNVVRSILTLNTRFDIVGISFDHDAKYVLVLSDHSR